MRKVWTAGFAAAVAGVLAAGPAAAQQAAPVQPASAVEAVQPEPTGPAAAELKRMEGYWKPQLVVFNGAQQVPPAQRALLTMVVKGSEFRTYYCRDVEKDIHFRLFTADVTLDPATHAIDLAVRDGQKKGERRHGIYELSGGTLKLCYGPTDKPRPTTFAAPAGSDIFFETWAVEKR